MTTRREVITKCGLGIAGIIAAGRAPAAIVKGLVGARESGLVGASEDFDNPYVTKGLIAMWDGEWNAGYGIHDPDAKAIANLVDANNYLTSGGTVAIGDNYFYADAFTGWWTAQYAMSIPFPCTVETVFKSFFKSNNSKSGYVYCYSSGGKGNSRYFYWQIGDAWVTNEIDGFNRICACSGLSSLQTSIGSFSLTYNDNNYNFTGWLNLIMKDNKNLGDYWPSSNVPCFFCRPPYNNNSKITSKGSSNAGGYIYCARIYNRALTDSEREHNYLVDKERFGL